MNLVVPQIIRRRVHIAFDSSKAGGWHLTKKATEDFLNAVSYTFPPGERFFIHSVQNYRDRITDPVLKEQVKDFIYQEAMHTKEHARCNVALTEAFPEGPKIEKLAATILSLSRRFTPKASQLASTCALEHFTAILADTLLSCQEAFISETDPAFAALWLWHAVEESEHKAVCFDVYQEVCGKGVLSYLHRVVVMFLTTVNFLVTLVYAVRLIKKARKNGAANRAADPPRENPPLQNATAEPDRLPRETGPSQAGEPNTPPNGEPALVQRPDPGLVRGLFQIVPLKLYLDYYRPSFHPWDHDNVHLIEEWRQRYRNFGSPDVALS